MITSKITSKAQTTIPQAVRVALGLKEGDEVAYQIEGDQVTLTKRRPNAFAGDPFAAFSEWSSDADTEDYADLEQGDVIRVPFPYTDPKRIAVGGDGDERP